MGAWQHEAARLVLNPVRAPLVRKAVGLLGTINAQTNEVYELL
jgi:hypothetical protein